MAKPPKPPKPPKVKAEDVQATVVRLCAVLVRRGSMSSHEMALVLKTGI